MVVRDRRALAPDEASKRNRQEAGVAALVSLSRLSRVRRRDRRSKARGERIVAILPAHNEAEALPATLRSLQAQTRPPDQIVVVSDNSTDGTDDLAMLHGAPVVVTVGNRTRKAGALNQALRRVLPHLHEDDYVLIMDADSQLKADWIECAVRAMRDDRYIGGVCGTYQGEEGPGLLRQLQRNEYLRGARMVRRRAELWVLSGAGTLFRVPALRAIAEERGYSLPGTPGDYYSGASITEDYELTLALKTLGYRCLAAPGCVAVTELMPTLRYLSRQRVRWQTGTLATLRLYGITRVTWTNWLRQCLFYGTYVVGLASWLVILSLFALHPGFSMPQWVLGALAITYFERLITVRKAGWKGILLALLLLPEWCYGMLGG